MAGKQHNPEEIIKKLRYVDVLAGKCQSRIDPIRPVQIREQTYYRWRKRHVGMGMEYSEALLSSYVMLSTSAQAFSHLIARVKV